MSIYATTPSLSLSIATVIGPALSGLIVATLGAYWAIGLGSVSFGISAWFIIRARIQERSSGTSPQGLRAEFKVGWQAVHSRPWLLISIANFALFQMLAMPTLYVLSPLLVRDNYSGEETWGLFMSSIGVGAIIGDLAAMRLKLRYPLVVAFAASALASPALLSLGLHAHVHAILGAAALFGFGTSMATVLWFTTLHLHIPSHLQSRVSSYDWLGSAVLRPLGYLLVGPLAETLGLTQTLLGAGFIVLALQVATASFSSIRQPRLAS
jgi:hypothetical protein